MYRLGGSEVVIQGPFQKNKMRIFLPGESHSYGSLVGGPLQHFLCRRATFWNPSACVKIFQRLGSFHLHRRLWKKSQVSADRGRFSEEPEWPQSDFRGSLQAACQ